MIPNPQLKVSVYADRKAIITIAIQMQKDLIVGLIIRTEVDGTWADYQFA